MVPETGNIVITGGQMGNSNTATKRVMLYNSAEGDVSSLELPLLNVGRFQHACGYYYDNLGQIVSLLMSFAGDDM